MVYQLYRRMMRKFAHFVLGFDNCPMGYRKNYREIAINVVNAAISCLVIITLLGVLAIGC